MTQTNKKQHQHRGARLGFLSGGIVFGVLGMVLHAGAINDASLKDTGTKNDRYCLVKEGKAQCAVVTGKMATPVEKHADEELRAYLKKLSGAEIAAVTEDQKPAASVLIYLGTPETQPAIARLGLSDKVARLSDEGFIIHADKAGVLIAGKKPIGVLYGVYTFLESNFDIRWFFPGEKGEYCPKRSTLEIGKIDENQNPAFIIRTFNMCTANINSKITDTWDWLVRNKMQIPGRPYAMYEKELQERGSRVGLLCELPAFVPQDKYFAEHPEYYPLVNGKRIPCLPQAYARTHPEYKLPDKAGRIYQICTSNPEVIDIFSKNVIALLKENQNGCYMPADMIYLLNNDGNGWCECEKCRSLDDPEEQKRGLVSARWYKFMNAVTEKVLKECPDKTLVGFGYQLFQAAPKGVKPDPRLYLVMAMHGRCFQHSYDNADCPANVDKTGLLKGWLQLGNITGVYGYYSVPGPYLPFEDIVARDIKYLSRIGVKFWVEEISPPDGVYGAAVDRWEIKEYWYTQFQAFYIAAKLLWNPSLDAGQLNEDLYQKYYGPAAPAMKSYRELLRKSWESARGHYVYGTSSSNIGKCLDEPGREQELLKYLSEAEKAATGNALIQERIGREKRYFSEIWQKQIPEWKKLTEQKEVKAKKRAEPVVIDGVLNEPDWKTMTPTSDFSASTTPAKAQTAVRLLYDEEYLYVGIEAMEPKPDKLQANTTQRDGPVWLDDDIEIFIDPAGTWTPYYHFAINSKGGIYDSKCASMGAYDTGWNAECEVACKTLADRWVVEMKIKASSLNEKITDGGCWKINIGRARLLDGGEVSSWAVDGGGFHLPASFRPVVFGNGPR